ncbi:MAG: coproporphyrinogen III oxidase, partial [Flavobacteriales bacterium]|nr:coproporphyrinogen III oxidase [Flavobacteriales bacterium]
IYGLPGMDLKEWDEQLRIALDHGMPHLSAYCLTVEPGTVLHHQVRKGVVIPATDPEVSAQFDHLMATMDAEGLIHYEISNFGREGHFSRHNRIYWNGEAYLGIGPSAHSFVGNERRWNVANNVRYARSVSDGTRYWEAELVGPKERTNEMIMTGLRTMWGVDLGTLPIDIRKHDQGRIVQYIRQGLIEKMDGRLVLSKAGRHLADRIASDLFVLDDR